MRLKSEDKWMEMERLARKEGEEKLERKLKNCTVNVPNAKPAPDRYVETNIHEGLEL